MIKARNLVAGAAIVAVGMAGLPGSGEAAWWKFGRDQSRSAAGDGVEMAQAQPQTADRFNRIENTLRNLMGQVEELTFQVRQLQDQLKRAQEDNEFRFKNLEAGGGGAPRKAAGAAEAPPPAKAETPLPEQQPERISEAPPAEGQTLGEPPQSIGTLILDHPPPDGSQPLDLSTLAQGGADAAPAPARQAALASTGDPATDFKAAYDLTVRGDYDLAEVGFRQFLTNYPGDPRAAEAQYWIGDSLFSRGRYGEAAAEFRDGYKKYPQSPKGAETLLKIGMSATATEDFASACKIYAQLLKQYPQASNALKQRVKVEQASAGC
jgi:tol-pal system protein YbgF